MRMSSITLVVAIGLAPSLATAACDPIDFQIRDFERLVRDDYFAASFFSQLTKDQFETAKKSLSASASYASLFEGNVDYSEFKRRVERFSSVRDIRVNSSTSMHYLSQRLSPAAQEMYSKCLEHDPSMLGLNVWLLKREGPYYTLKARWIGGEGVAGKLTGKIEDGIKILSQVPDDWSRAYTYEITAKKDDCAASGALIFKVNNDSKNYVLLGDAPTPQHITETVRYSKPAVAKSGGNWAPDPAVDTQCISPSKPGARLDSATAYFVDVKRSDGNRTSVRWTSQTPDSLCWEVSAKTGAREHAVTVSAGAAIVQIIPQPARACNAQ
jgi:hypothetical protein